MAALTILDSLSKNQRNFTKKDYMLYHFLLADAHNQFFIPMKADTFMTDVADYYDTPHLRNSFPCISYIGNRIFT